MGGRAAGRPGSGHRRRGWLLVAGLAALLAVAVLAVVGRDVLRRPAEPPGAGQRPDAGSGGGPVADDYPFGPDSIWRADVSGAPVHPDSDAMVEGLVEQIEPHFGGVAAFNVENFTASWYTVGPDQPGVDVAWDDCQDKGWVQDGLLGEGGQFSDVPIPPDAEPSPGSDGQLTVYSPSRDQLWEFWQARRTGDGWSACWGGRIDDASSSPGYFEGGFGASASGLAMSAGTVWVDDARRGEINHALGLALIYPAAWPRTSWPAQRTDGGNTDPAAIPQGARLRLDPDLDVDSLELTPLARMVARAAQRYGFVVTDTAGAVNIGAQLGQPADADPGFWEEQMRGVPPHQILAGFPWDRLEVLPQDWGKPARGS